MNFLRLLAISNCRGLTGLFSFAIYTLPVKKWWLIQRTNLATFKGTNSEFRRYIGPRLRNVVNMITKKQRAVVGACEHCGFGESLESAHVYGRDRIQIIDLLLESTNKGDAVEVDLKQFEEAFKSEHEPFEKAILVLCTACHRKYGSPAVRPKALGQAENDVDEEVHPLGPGLVESNILPITLDPTDPSVFKKQLLKRKAAEITTFYKDGRTVTRPWISNRFAATSNVFGNLRSRPEFRQGEWQAHGIIKVHVRVLSDD